MQKRRGRGRKRAGAVGGGKRGDLLGEREREKKSENERVRSADAGGGADEGGVCPGKKSIQSDRDNVFV